MLAELFAIVVCLQLALIGFAAWALYQIIRQQGRILRRMDTFEERLDYVYKSVARLETQMEEGVGAASALSLPMEAPGLPIGTSIAPFRFPDLAGDLIEWNSFRGQRVLLVHWNPQCGFCEMLAPKLAKAVTDLQAKNVRVLLLSYGDAQANLSLLQAHDLEVPVLLMKDVSETIEAFQRQGTPVAYLTDEEGRVAAALTIGLEPVSDLIRRVIYEDALIPLTASEDNSVKNHRAPERLRAGNRAPQFQLPDTEGNTVSLETRRGSKVLLVFSDPECSSCERLAPELERLQQANRKNGLQVLMIAYGDAQANRRKAEMYQFTFPVLLQHKSDVARQYGIQATPAAFLINEEGVIMRDVAAGAEAILALVPQREPALSV